MGIRVFPLGLGHTVGLLTDHLPIWRYRLITGGGGYSSSVSPLDFIDLFVLLGEHLLRFIAKLGEISEQFLKLTLQIERITLQAFHLCFSLLQGCLHLPILGMVFPAKQKSSRTSLDRRGVQHNFMQRHIPIRTLAIPLFLHWDLVYCCLR